MYRLHMFGGLSIEGPPGRGARGQRLIVITPPRCPTAMIPVRESGSAGPLDDPWLWATT
jgi:hypothetical protein